MTFLYRLIAADVSAATANHQRERMTQTCALFTLVLLGVTWRLWTQQDAYPQIPLIEWTRSVPRWVDIVALGALAVGSINMALPNARSWQRLSTATFLLAAGLLIATDQHRLQPWLYQFMILAVFLSFLSAKDYVIYARILLVSIYLFSAWSKVDYQFLHTLGLQFASELFGKLGLGFNEWPETARLAGAALFPLGELVVGVGLIIPLTRKITAYFSIVLHVVLLLILGPWGLKHHYGVLAWNAFFIAQIWVLFLPGAESPTEIEPTADAMWKHRLSWLIVLLPILEPFGLLDHWPAWQLYAPRNSRVTMSVLETSLDKLPVELQPFISPTATGFSHRFDLDRWSLDSIGVPIYPQNRFQLGVAIGLAEKYHLGGGIQVQLQETASRSNGERNGETLRSVDELRASAEKFRLNALPRSVTAIPLPAR